MEEPDIETNDKSEIEKRIVGFMKFLNERRGKLLEGVYQNRGVSFHPDLSYSIGGELECAQRAYLDSIRKFDELFYEILRKHDM